MTKSEIALQLALSRAEHVVSTKTYGTSESNAEYNKDLGIQLASLYNSIYDNLNCADK